MLCPEVSNFPPPKVMELKRENQSLEAITILVNRNSFYRSIIVTCPDEIQPPSFIQEIITEDTDYYKLSKCSIVEFVDPVFIQSFVKNGKIYCLSTGTNCIIQNCVAITPDGMLTLHILEYIFQTLGFEGVKRPHGFYEVKIDLKNIKNYDKVILGLSKLELFDIFMVWEPNNENICPSSIAKYFCDREVDVSVNSLNLKNISPNITEVPSLKDVDIEEIVEWIGLIAHEVDLNPTDDYISSYSQPDSEDALKTTRISEYIVKGFIPSSIVISICERLEKYVASRGMSNYWASVSIQSDENCLWQWNASSPKMFQAHNSSCNVFFTHNNHTVYSIGQLKYS